MATWRLLRAERADSLMMLTGAGLPDSGAAVAPARRWRPVLQALVGVIKRSGIEAEQQAKASTGLPPGGGRRQGGLEVLRRGVGGVGREVMWGLKRPLPPPPATTQDALTRSCPARSCPCPPASVSVRFVFPRMCL